MLSKPSIAHEHMCSNRPKQNIGSPRKQLLADVVHIYDLLQAYNLSACGALPEVAIQLVTYLAVIALVARRLKCISHTHLSYVLCLLLYNRMFSFNKHQALICILIHNCSYP